MVLCSGDHEDVPLTSSFRACGQRTGPSAFGPLRRPRWAMFFARAGLSRSSLCAGAPSRAGWLFRSFTLPSFTGEPSPTVQDYFRPSLSLLPVTCRRCDSEHLAYLLLRLGIWFLEDQGNAAACFTFPCHVSLWWTEVDPRSLLLLDSCLPGRVLLQQTFVFPIQFAHCYWGGLPLECAWPWEELGKPLYYPLCMTFAFFFIKSTSRTALKFPFHSDLLTPERLTWLGSTNIASTCAPGALWKSVEWAT